MRILIPAHSAEFVGKLICTIVIASDVADLSRARENFASILRGQGCIPRTELNGTFV
jgi:hypothetical protein